MILQIDFNDRVTLRGLTLTPTMLVVFELYLAKQASHESIQLVTLISQP